MTMPKIIRIPPTDNHTLAFPRQFAEKTAAIRREIEMRYPKYKSHKIVEAIKIKAVEYSSELDGGATIVPYGNFPLFRVDPEYMDKHHPAAGGYWVRYPDGYESWSPAKAFEQGYTKIEDGSPAD